MTGDGSCRVALICYKIERGKGSESGSGYNIASRLADRVELTLITRQQNIGALETDPAFAATELVAVDVPRAWTWWKRGARGVVPYYYLWQRRAAKVIKGLHRQRPFDVVHQYNFHTDWAPHFIAAHGAKMVWGPICHQPPVPGEYFRHARWREGVRELAKTATKNAFWRLDPNLSKAIRRTDVILYANEDIAPPFRRIGQAKVRLQTFGGAEFIAADAVRSAAGSGAFTVLHVGRLVPIKGIIPAVDAFAEFVQQLDRQQNVRFLIVGDGPMREYVSRYVHSVGIDRHVEFHTWMPHTELSKVYETADVLLYPSLGNQDTVVAEALAAGLPIVCGAGTGTKFMAGDAGLAVPTRPYAEFVDWMADALALLHKEFKDDHPSFDARVKQSLERAHVVSWDHTAERLLEHYV